MSATVREILNGAAITLGTTITITDINKITQVIVASKIQKKDFSTTTLKKLLKRCETEPTEAQITQLFENADKAFGELKALKREERLEIAKTKITIERPPYVVEMFDEDGMPTGIFTLDYIKYSDYLHKEKHIYNLLNTLFVYTEEKHTYREHVNEIQTHTRDIFKTFNLGGKLLDIEREVNAHVKSMGCVREYPFIGRYETVHVKNGALNLSTGILSEPTPEHMYDYRIETDYRKFPDGTPELDAFLELYKIREPIDILAKVLWQRAYHDTLKELVVFVGPKDCGKTTLAEFVQATLDGDLYGKNNVGRILLHELLQRFGYANLEGKLMNLGDDLPDMFVKNSGRINEIVGSVNRHIEKKGKDGYDAITTAYYVFTTNNLPPLDDDDNAIWSKIRIVVADTPVIGEKIPRTELFTQLLREQLLYRAIERAMGYTKKPYVKDQSVDFVRALWHESTLDVDAFLLEATEFDTSKFISLGEIKEHYERWCVMRGKKLHIKYLNKKLQSYITRRSMANGYTIRIKPLSEWNLKQEFAWKSGQQSMKF